MTMWKTLAAASLLLASSYAGATTISYDVNETDASTHTWQYDFTINNDTLNSELVEFSIYFELDQASNLQLIASPGSWDSLLIQPDPLLPDHGFLDSIPVGPGLAPGAALSGFSVAFVFLGNGIPGAQDFDVFDADFNLIESGRTRANGVASVAEPGSVLLLGLALLMLGARGKGARTGRMAFSAE